MHGHGKQNPCSANPSGSSSEGSDYVVEECPSDTEEQQSAGPSGICHTLVHDSHGEGLVKRRSGRLVGSTQSNWEFHEIKKAFQCMIHHMPSNVSGHHFLTTLQQVGESSTLVRMNRDYRKELSCVW